MKKIIIILVAFLFLINLVVAEPYVYDEGGIFSESTEERLNEIILEDFEKAGVKIRIITIPKDDKFEENFKSDLFEAGSFYFDEIGLNEGETYYNLLIILLIDNNKIIELQYIFTEGSVMERPEIDKQLPVGDELMRRLGSNDADIRGEAAISILNKLKSIIGLMPELQISIVGGTGIPEILLVDPAKKDGVGVFATYEYRCSSSDPSKRSCKELEDGNLIDVEVEKAGFPKKGECLIIDKNGVAAKAIYDLKDAKRLPIFEHGAKVKLEDEKKGWFKISYNGKLGWVRDTEESIICNKPGRERPEGSPIYGFFLKPDEEENYKQGEVNILIYTRSLLENQKYILRIYSYAEPEPRLLLEKTFSIKLKPLPPECQILIKGKEEKFKIYFIGEAYQQQEKFKKDLSLVLDYDSKGYGIFSVEPFKSDKEKFTIYYNEHVQENDAEHLNSECPHDITLILSNRDFRTTTYIDSKIALISISRLIGSISISRGGGAYISIGNYNYLQKAVVHEFGHLFGNLADEYVEKGKADLPEPPNCASDLKTAGKWWDDLEGVGEGDMKVGFFLGCAYVIDNIRPTDNSIMRYQSKVADKDWKHGYGPVNERCLLKILEEGGICEEVDIPEIKKDYTSNIKRVYSRR